MSALSRIKRFSREVVETLPILMREFAKRENNPLSSGCISFPQMVALDHIAHEKHVTMSELAKLLSVQMSSATVLVDRLVREKLLTRRRDERDRRVVWVSLTPKGRAALSQIVRQKRRSVEELFGVLSATERAQYLKALNKVKAHISRTLPVLALLFLLSVSDAQAFWPFSSKAPEKRTPAVSSAAVSPDGLTLSEAYALALVRSEDVAIRKDILDEAQGHFYQAIDVVMPKVHFEMTHFTQDAPETAGSSDGISQSATRPSTPQKKFTFSQPLFSGFKEFAALQASGAEKAQRRHEIDRAKQVLFIDVMDSFYALAEAKNDAAIIDATRLALEERLKELNARVELGRSRESELQTALAALKVNEARRILAKRDIVATRQLLEFYIGKPLTEELVLSEAHSSPPADLTPYLGRAELRPDVRAAAEAQTLAEKNVVVAQSGLFPEISLDGNYYTQRVGFQSGNDWDTTLKFDIPIFEGTEVFGDIKVAASQREQAEESYSKTLRMALLEIRTTFEDLVAAIEVESVYREANDALKKNYEMQSAEYLLNLVNNLDVLEALKSYQDIQLELNRTSFETRRTDWQFRIATGEIP